VLTDVNIEQVSTVRRYASKVYVITHVCLSVCPSQAAVVLKWLDVGSHKQCCTISQGLWFTGAKDLVEILVGFPQTGVPNTGGIG